MVHCWRHWRRSNADRKSGAYIDNCSTVSFVQSSPSRSEIPGSRILTDIQVPQVPKGIDPGANGSTENELGNFQFSKWIWLACEGHFLTCWVLHDVAYAASADGSSLWLVLRLLSRNISDVKRLASRHDRNQETHFLLVRLDIHYKNVWFLSQNSKIAEVS